jgi:Tfp pilus assembly protein PilX
MKGERPLKMMERRKKSPDRSRGEEGIALLTVLMLTVILTVIGIASITTTSMDIKMAGGERMRETSLNAAEACLSSGAQIIQQTLLNAAIPNTLLGPTANPYIADNTAGLGAPPLNPLEAEIMGTSDNNPDNVDPAAFTNPANAVLTLPGFKVNMDIDRLYVRPKAGASLAFGAGYEGTGGGAAGGGVEILYRIDCYATSTNGQTTGRVTGVYACVSSGDTCQRKIG